MPRTIHLPRFGRRAAVVVAAIALLVSGGVAYAAVTVCPTQSNPSHAQLEQYMKCRLDAIEVKVDALAKPPVTTTVTTTVTAPPQTVTVTGTPTSSTTSPTTTMTSPTTEPTSSTTTTAPAANCAPVPSACGYPDTTNTGAPAGTTLTKVPADATSGPGWSYDTRGWVVVTGTDAVLSGYDFTVGVNIYANGVTIKNSRVTVSGEGWGVGLLHAQSVTIQNVTIAGPTKTGPNRLLVGIKDVYGDASGTRILANHFANTATGIQTHEGLIQDNYIHDMGLNTGDHVNGTTSNGATTPMTIRHNTILNQYSQTDAISLFQDFGPEGNRVIDNNLIAGGGYTLYAGANAGKESTATNIAITNNRFSRLFFPNGGYYGPFTAYTPTGGNSFTGNVWDDTGAPVNG